MSYFPTSTQRHRWMFTAHSLHEQHIRVNRDAINTLVKKFAKAATQGEEVPAGLLSPEDRSAFLSVEEEVLLRKYYEHKIQAVTAAFNFPRKIQSTALIYFKRFYLRRSVMEYHPKAIMLTCVYLACKTEESYVSVEEFGRGVQQNPDAVLRHELPVLEALDFELVVFAPHRALRGFLHDFKVEQAKLGNVLSAEKLKECTSVANKFADRIMLSDAVLLHPPGMLALAALLAGASHCGLDVTNYIEASVPPRAGNGEGALLPLLQAILDTANKEAQPPVEALVRNVDKRLKVLKPPSTGRDKEEKRALKKAGGAKDAMLAPPHSAMDTSTTPQGPEAKRRKSAEDGGTRN
eukprot:jgi/Mesvir1/6441/Mv19524-RA.1